MAEHSDVVTPSWQKPSLELSLFHEAFPTPRPVEFLSSGTTTGVVSEATCVVFAADTMIFHTARRRDTALGSALEKQRAQRQSIQPIEHQGKNQISPRRKDPRFLRFQ
jgi:hypothetical protein